MKIAGKTVDGFVFMPPSLGAWIGRGIPEEPYRGVIPWTPFNKKVEDTTFALMTSAGISLKTDPPFDTEREKREPFWGDPAHREIPVSFSEEDIDVNHLHINTDYISKDINLALPINRFRELQKEGIIGRIAPTSYSYYGYQLNPEALLRETMPKVSYKMKEEEVESVILTPA